MKKHNSSVHFKCISLLFLSFILILSCTKKNEKSFFQNTTSLDTITTSNEENFYQWQIRKIPVKYSFTAGEEAEIYPLFEVYLYETITDTKHFIFSRVDRTEPYSTNTHLPLMYYEPGGSTFYFTSTENNKLQVILTFISTGFSEDSSSEEEDNIETDERSVVFEMDLNGIQLKEKPPVGLAIPQFTRTLQRTENQDNLYGDDIFYLQTIISHFYDNSIEIDGYYGKQTEQLIKNIQKEKGLLETGIVDIDLWSDLTDTKKTPVNY